MKIVLVMLLLPVFAYSAKIDSDKAPVSNSIQNINPGTTVIKFNPSLHVNKKSLEPGKTSFELRTNLLKIINIQPLTVSVITSKDTVRSVSFTISRKLGKQLQAVLASKYTVTSSLADVPEWIIDNCSLSLYETSDGYRGIYKQKVFEAQSIDAEKIFSELPTL